MNQAEIINAFAELYWSAIEKYNDYHQNFSDERVSSKRFASEFRASLKWLLKHCGTLIPPKASIGAIEIARRHSIDLFALQWKDQPKAEKVITGARGRNLFIHEHEIPVSILYQEILKAESKEQVKNILSQQSIVWITREENKRLAQYIREENAYVNAGIEHVENPYADEWMEKPWQIKQ